MFDQNKGNGRFKQFIFPGCLFCKSTKQSAFLEEALNLEYLDDVKVKLYLCFSNEYKKKLINNSRMQDALFYQYYSAEIEYLTIKIDRSTKTANFLCLPLFARDGFYKGGVQAYRLCIRFLRMAYPLTTLLTNTTAWSRRTPTRTRSSSPCSCFCPSSAYNRTTLVIDKKSKL